MRVSVIIPVWNGAATVAGAIESALEQDFDGAVEVVAVNDGSADATQAVLESFGRRITTVRQANRGLAAARNAGVRASSGEFIAFLDADDQWMRQKLARTVSMLIDSPRTAMVYSDAVNVDGDGLTVSESYIPACQDHAPTMAELLAGLWNILPSTMVLRRTTFDRIGGFCEQFRGPYCEDIYFLLRARELGPFRFIRERLVLYRYSNPAETLRKRLEWVRDCIGAGDLTGRLCRLMENYDLLVRLVDGRYPRSARKLKRGIRRRQVDLLSALGMTAVTRGDSAIARRSYSVALRYAPLDARTYARLAWTLLPARMRAPLSSVMPQRLARSLGGPAQG